MRFRLRRWMLLPASAILLLLAVPLLAAAVLVHRARQEQQAVAEIERLGGSVYYHHQVDGHIIDSSAESPGPKWLRRLLGENVLVRVHTVWLQYWDVPAWKHRPVTDDDLAVLDSLGSLQKVMLDGSQVTDAGLKRLQRHRLTEIHLNQVPVTDDGMGHLAEIDTLISLNLGGTKVTNQSLATFRKMPQLRWVAVGSTQISDEAIDEFNRERGSAVIHNGRGPFIPPP